MPHVMVKLSDIVDALDGSADETHYYLDRQTGKVEMINDEDIACAEDDDGDDTDPAGQQEVIETTRLILEDEETKGGRFVALPGKHDLQELSLMRNFAKRQTVPGADSLLDATYGRGLYRRFKDRLDDLGLRDQWYAYKEKAIEELARAWCEEHGITAI